MATTPVMKMTPPWTPELLPEVQRVVEEFLGEEVPLNRTVLEVGGGWSSRWFCDIAREVHTIEHSEDWAKEIRKTIPYEVQRDRWTLDVHIPEVFGYSISMMRETFKVVLIDCVDEARLPSLFASLAKCWGWIILDDSHWEMFEEVPKIMERMGYSARTFSGNHTRKTGEVKFHQTTIFSKGQS